MPKDLFQQLRKVWVCNKQLQISLMNAKTTESFEKNDSSGDSPRKSRRSGKPRTRARDKARRPSQRRQAQKKD